MEIITLRRDGLQGQAWIIFDDTHAATAALQAENGFTFFGKDLKIAYAKETSDRIAKRDGTYVPKAKRKKIMAESTTTNNNNNTNTNNTTTTQEDNTENTTTTSGENGVPLAPPTTTTTTTISDPPSPILFAQDLPSECNEMMLAMLFRQYPGFQEVRMPRPGLAFVQFDNEPHATIAMERLNGFHLTPTDTLKLHYGKQ